MFFINIVFYLTLIFFPIIFLFFFFNDTATTEIYTLSLHDALPIFRRVSALQESFEDFGEKKRAARVRRTVGLFAGLRSEEHTSELQSRSDLVCRLLLEKKKRPRTIG